MTQNHIKRLDQISQTIQNGWNNFAKTAIHIHSFPDLLVSEYGYELPAISVEHLIVVPAIVVVKTISTHKIWGWKVQRVKAILGSPISEDEIEYEDLGYFNNDMDMIKFIIGEIAIAQAFVSL